MDTDTELARIQAAIETHRKRAESYRQLAVREDGKADALRAEAAKLGTGELPLMGGPNADR